MSTVDERIVRMSFDNAQFQQNIQATLDQLQELNKNLKLTGAGKGLQDLGAAANGVKLDGISSGIDAIRSKFSALSIIGITALTNIANKAVDAGLRMAKSFTIEPIAAGFRNYETQINAVQTILANTGLKGKAGLDQVTAALDQLNEYANKTVYNFSEMARNVGTFTAAGVKLDVAKDAIKGIANLAALSGSNSEQASMAMYQLSQAIAANQVKLQDWNSVVNAGLGGQIFQKALFDTAKQLGTIKNVPMGQTFEQWTKAGNSFRGSLQDGWITGEVLTKTLGKFTGDLTEAQLKSQGYNAEQIKEIQELGRTAVNAATKIKTFHQLTDALKEEVASAYASVFKTLFGDINEATTFFTALHNVVQNLLTGPIYALNDVLKDWVKLGGKKTFIDALKLAFKDLAAIIKPIKEAFRDIFPATTGQTLLNLTNGFASLVKSFKMGAETAENLRRTFRGVFAVFDIVWQVIKQTAEFIGSLIGEFGAGKTAGVLAFTANLGDMIVKFDKIVKKGQGLAKFFEAIRSVLAGLAGIVHDVSLVLLHFAEDVHAAFQKIDIGAALQAMYEKVTNFVKNLFTNVNFDDVAQVLSGGLLAAISVALFKLVKLVKGFLGGSGGNPFSGVISAITAPFNSLTETLESMQKALQAAVLLQIALAVGALTLAVIALSKVNQKDLDKALQALTMMFVQLFASLAAFNRIGGAVGLVKTGAGLILVATAIRILVSAVTGLSGMNWQELSRGLTALAGIMAILIVGTRGLTGQSAGMISTGAALLILSAAIKVLVSAVKDFAVMSWSEIAKGLTGVAALLVSLALFTKFAAVNKGAIAQSAGLILLATAMKILASAAQDFAGMSWSEIGKGLASVSAILLAVGIFSKTAGNPATLLSAGIALNGIAISMTIFAKAMAAFGKIAWNGIAKGLVSMAVSLGVIAIAMNAMPKGMIVSAAGLFVVAKALVVLGDALKSMGGMSWGEIAKGLTVLAASLILIAAAVIVMQEALPGAAALLVVAGAMSILIKALDEAGQMSWGEIGKSMVVLAGAFIILGAAGVALTPVIPTLIGLGLALTAFGVAIALIGGGIALLSIGLTGLAVSGAAGAAAFGAFVAAVVAQMPVIVAALAKTLIAILKAIADATPQLVQTAIVLVTGLLTAITTLAPKIIAALVKVINDLLNALAKNIPGFLDKATRIILAIVDGITRNAPRVIAAVINMIVSMLNAIAANLPNFITAAVNVIVSFLNGLAAQLPRVIDAGVNLVIKFIEGIAKGGIKLIDAAAHTLITFLNNLADAIRNYESQLMAAGGRIAAAIIQGLIDGIGNLWHLVWEKIKGLAGGLIDGFMSLIGAKSPSKVFMEIGGYITQGLAIGIAGGTKNVLNTMANVNKQLMSQANQAKARADSLGKQLASLNAQANKNPVAIYLTQMALAQAREEVYRSQKALWDLNVTNKAQITTLTNLGKSYDALVPKIADANKKVADAKKIRDDYAKSVKDQENTLPDISEDTALVDYMNTINYKINDLKKFTDVMTKLRGMGLNDALYRQLIEKGPAALGFAEQLLEGGTDAVKKVDGLSDQLTKAAGNLGTSAGQALYQAGVNAAQGIVDGLVKQQSAIAAQMSKIAAGMVSQIKRDLGIRSPSRVMRDLGENVVKGLSGGVRDTANEAVDAAKDVGKATLDAMGKALAGASDILDDNANLNPVIAPVVDLTEVRKGAGQLSSLLNDKQLNVAATFASARDASAGYLDNKLAAADAVAGASPTSAPGDITFIQNNNSPKALSSVEIYRQTNNQLSRLRGAVTPNVA